VGGNELLATILLVFVTANFIYGAVLTRLDPPSKNDFTSYYVAAQTLRRGAPEALYYPEPVGSLLAQASEQHPWIDVARASGVENPNYYLYPPLFALAVLPLAWLSYPAAFSLWLLANVAFLAASLWLLLGGRQRVNLLGLSACVLLAGAFYPVWHHLKIGQSSLLLLLLLSATLALLRRGKDLPAGLLLSGAILLKLTPAILILLLVVRRRWRAVWGAIGGVVGLSALSAILTGWQAQVTYFTRMVPLLSAGTAFYPNQSLNGFITRVLGAGAYRLADLSAELWVPRIGATIAAVALLAVTALFLLRRASDAREESLEDGFAGLVLLSLLVSPISWEHHYVLALLPAWILAARLGRPGGYGNGVPVAAGLSLALIGSYIGVNVFEKFGPGPLGPILSSAAFLGGLLLWWLIVSGRTLPGRSAAGAKTAAPLLLLMAVFAGGQFLFKVAEYNTSFSYGDFTSYYVAASAVVGGKGDLPYEPETPDMILAKVETPSEWKTLAEEKGVRDANFYLYPPFFAILVSPIGLLSYERAHDLWYALNLIALGGFLLWYLRADRTSLTAAERGAAVILIALLWPALFTFGAGQANYIILFLIFGGILSAERGRSLLAGLLLAAATAIKLTPGLLVAYYLWKRRFSLVAWAVAGFAALSAASVAVVGWRANVIYAAEMVPLLSRGCAHWVNQSVSAFLSRLQGAGMFEWDLAPESSFVRAGTALVSLMLVGALAFLSRPGAPGSTGRLEVGLVLVTSLFMSPISWIHHAVMSLPALYFLMRHLVETGRVTFARAAVLAAAFTLFGIYFRPFGFLQSPLLTPLASYHLLGQILLWSLLALEVLHLRRRAASEANS
jgi:alpha-1,2-mannosyltransferase